MKFVATQWATAEEKDKWAAKFQKFVLSGFKQARFTKEIYNRLNGMFGHIAHYNLDGFYDVWFARLDARVRFLERIRDRPVYGDPAHTWSDVEGFLQDWVKADPGIIATHLQEHRSLEQQADLARLEELIKQYPDQAEQFLKEADSLEQE